MLAAVGAAFAVRLVAVLTSFVVNDSVLIPDEGGYLGLARTVARGRSADSWYPGYGQSLYRSTWAFTATLTRAIELFGGSRLVGQLLAVSFALVTVALTVKLALYVAPAATAFGAGLVVAALPSSIIWSSTVLRESLVWAAAALVGLGVTMSASKGRQAFVGVAAVLVGILVLGATRGQTAVVASWAAGLVALTMWRRAPVAAGLLLVCLFTPVVSGLGVGGSTLLVDGGATLSSTRVYLGLDARTSIVDPELVGPAQPHPDEANDPAGGPLGIARRDPVGERDGRRIIEGGGGQLYAVDEGLGATLRAAPRGLVAMLVQPLPWETTVGVEPTAARVENVAWWGLYVLAAIGTWRLRRSGAGTWFVILFVAGIVATGSVTQGNVGTAFRHRSQFLWAIAVLAAVGTTVVLERREGWRASDTPLEGGSQEPLAVLVDR